MISIIISSTRPEYLENVQQNINLTIGVPFEIISVENKNGLRSLNAVYNQASKNAKYAILCYMHEDLLFKTNDWGQKVVEIMKDPCIGLLGVAGATYKSLAPSGWVCPGIEEETKRVNVIQQYKFERTADRHEYFNPENEKLSRVACIDGLWMCTRKSIVSKIGFDESLSTYFHGYDVDFSLRIAPRYHTYVTFEVLIEHFSEGHFSSEWLRSAVEVNFKHRKNLPLNTGNYSVQMIRYAERFATKVLLKKMSNEKYSKWNKISMLYAFELHRVLGIKTYLLFILKIILGRY